MKVRVKLFAVARQRIGQESIEVEVSSPATIHHLRGAIVEQHPTLIDVVPHVRFAINSEYANDAVVIPAAAEIAIIPPVSGG